MRYGNRKGIVSGIKDGNTHIELYNIENDPIESEDVSILLLEITVSESYDSTVMFCPKNIGTASDSLLRAAIACAKDGDTITLCAVIGGDTIFLDSALIIDKNINIISQGGVHISGAGTVRAFDVEPGHTVVFEGFNIICGTSIVGAGVRNQGSLRLNDMNVIADAGTPESAHLVQNKSGGSLTIEGDTDVRNDD